MTLQLNIVMFLATSRTEIIDQNQDFPNRQKEIYSTFVNIVRPGMMDSFKEKWGDWFVLQDTVQDEKTPGKLKGIKFKPKYFSLKFSQN